MNSNHSKLMMKTSREEEGVTSDLASQIKEWMEHAVLSAELVAGSVESADVPAQGVEKDVQAFLNAAFPARLGKVG